MEENELDLVDLLKMCVAKWWVLVLCAVVAGVGFFLYSTYLIDPLYRSSTTLYVDPNNNGQPFNVTEDAASVTYAQKVIETYMEILRTKIFLQSVADDVGGGYTSEQILKMVSISAIGKTELFKVEVTSTDPDDAYRIAQSFERLAPQKIIEVKGVNAVRIADPAVFSDSRINNDTLRNTAVGILFGLCAAVGILVLLSMFDTRIKDENDILKHYKLNILGTIPNFDATSGNKYKYKNKNRYAEYLSFTDPPEHFPEGASTHDDPK